MSQSIETILRLREMITGGDLAPGQRVSELAVVERLGVSRTPVRAALARLEQEGLLEAIPSGGFMVKAFSEGDIRDAIELRGTLEGLAARLAAERGASGRTIAKMRDLVEHTDALLDASGSGSAMSDASALAAYVPLNSDFHALLVEMAQSPVVGREIERVNALPFASPTAFLSVRGSLFDTRTILTVAQDQHRAAVDAIEAREGARAQAIMQEHARLASRHLDRVLQQPTTFATLAGHGLVRRLQTI